MPGWQSSFDSKGYAVRLFDTAIAPIGRRKHVLDLTTGAFDWPAERDLGTVGAHIAKPSRFRPLGYRQPDECSLFSLRQPVRLSRERRLPRRRRFRLKRPAWNLSQVDERPGLLFVEAMARGDDSKKTPPAVAAAYISSRHAGSMLSCCSSASRATRSSPLIRESGGVRIERPGIISGTSSREHRRHTHPHKSGGSMSILIATLPVQESSGNSDWDERASSPRPCAGPIAKECRHRRSPRRVSGHLVSSQAVRNLARAAEAHPVSMTL